MVDIKDVRPFTTVRYENRHYVVTDKECEPGFVVATRDDGQECTFEHGDMVELVDHD